MTDFAAMNEGELRQAERTMAGYAVRIGDLEARLSDTDEGMNQNATVQAAKIRELDSEVRKLWDNVWKQAKDRLGKLEAASKSHSGKIAANEKSVKALQDKADGAAADLAHDVLPCESGSWCVGGTLEPCPAGRFGEGQGLSNASCTGACAPGFWCQPGSERDDGFSVNHLAARSCPAGHVCLGDGREYHPCPVGTYREATGGSSFDDCTRCPAGTFQPATAQVAPAACRACPNDEGSTPGASACWPSLVSAVAHDASRPDRRWRTGGALRHACLWAGAGSQSWAHRDPALRRLG